MESQSAYRVFVVGRVAFSIELIILTGETTTPQRAAPSFCSSVVVII